MATAASPPLLRSHLPSRRRRRQQGGGGTRNGSNNSNDSNGSNGAATADGSSEGSGGRGGERRERAKDEGDGELSMDVKALRRQFPVLERRINGRLIIYLDNACMTLKPEAW